jgi:hypothetical protein
MQGNLDYLPRQERIRCHIQHMERVLARCENINRRFIWGRLSAFLSIGLATWCAATVGGSRAGWLAFVSTVVIFFTIIALHRRLDLWSARFRAWNEIYTQELARLTLDWDLIPPPAALFNEECQPLALDLDLTGSRSLHHLIDTAISRQGSKLLADWLTNDTPDVEQISVRQAVVSELAGLHRFRKRLALLFRMISKEPLDDVRLLGWLQTPFPGQILNRVLPVATLLGMVNIGLFYLNIAGILPAYWVLSGFLYAVIYASNYGSIGLYLDAVRRLDSELRKYQGLLQYLETYPLGKHLHLTKICSPFRESPLRPTRILRRVRLLTTAAGLNNNPVLGLLVNLLVPWNLWTAVLISRYRKRMACLLPVWLDTFHMLEALISLGTFTSLHPDYKFPDIHADAWPVLEFRSLGHPLLAPERKVSNDFQIETLGDLSIITGSNMAGKSTFIRTIGVNLCLAYAGGPVNADYFRCLPFRLYTCIRINDSLGDGFSYFYAEVKRLKGLLEALKPDENSDHGATNQPMLYLIDEIFRGTNNRERMIGSRAYVKTLIGTKGIGLIATHDLDLAHLADTYPQVHNFHFRDAVQEGKLVFDYIIRPGPSPTTNALKIMQMEGLPVS